MSSIVPSRLTVEYAHQHCILDEPAPRFGWICEAVDPASRNLGQLAWQVQVVSEAPTFGTGIFHWDSGRVESTACSGIEYEGRTLASRGQHWWRVRVWDLEGKCSGWSSVSSWEMGLLSPADWVARWITVPDPLTMERVCWIWAADEPEAHKKAAEGTVIFEKEISFPVGLSPVASACALIMADDRFELSVNGLPVAESELRKDDWKRVPRLYLGALLPGRNRITIAVTNESAGETAGLAGKIIFRHVDNSQSIVMIDGSWQARRAGGDWLAAAVLAYATASGQTFVPLESWGNPERGDYRIVEPPAIFRRRFTLESIPAHARLYAAARGLVEIRVNGKRVDEDYFVPGWPDYRKRQYYVTRDVQSLLREGENLIEATLADGWYAGYVAWATRRDHYAGEKSLLVQFEFGANPSSVETIGTDGQWDVAIDGPIRHADTLVGEYHDARREPLEWRHAVVSHTFEVPLQSYRGEPVRITEELRPIAIHEPSPGTFVADLGQNMVGVVRLRVTGPRGTTIRVRHAEILRNDGNVYTEALRDAPSTDTYVKGTDGEEIWHPHFTFHGFRYVELSGLAHAATHETLTGLVMHSAFRRAGDFTCSSQLVNQLQRNIVWSQRGNSLEVPTDCPQRDERLGWTGDAQVFIGTSTFNYDLAAYWTRWIEALFDAQMEAGWIPYTAPTLPILNGSEICAAGWADAAVVCPWAMFRTYGDTRIAKRYWAQMERYMSYLEGTSIHLIRPDQGFGDWLSLNAPTPVDLMSTAFFAWDASLMAEMAEAIGKPDRAQHFRNLFVRIREAYNARFVTPDGRIKGNTQTCYVHALAWDLLPENLRPKALAHLVQDIEYRGMHFSTGFMGLRDLFPVLSRFGRKDIAHRLLLAEEFPSWGYEIRCGATTIWERWDGWNEHLGLQSAEMNSFNHYSLGAVGEWLFRNLGGINEAAPGFTRVKIAPEFSDAIPTVRTRLESIRGVVSSERWRDGKALHLRCRVPVGVAAEVCIPTTDPNCVRELGASAGPPVIESTNGGLRYLVGSGVWHFTWPSEN